MDFEIEVVGNATFLVKEILECEQVDTFSLGMLMNNDIKELLPCSVIQRDHVRHIRYNITSMVTLKQFSSSILNRKKTLNLLKSIADAYSSAEQYMLDSTHILVDMQYIYVNVSTGEAKLLFVPWNLENKESMIDFMKRVLGGFQYDQNEDVKYVLTLLNAFNSGKISQIVDLIDTIEALRESEKPHQILPPTHAAALKKIPVQGAAEVQQKPIQPVQVSAIPHVQNTPNIPVQASQMVGEASGAAQQEKKGFFHRKPKPEKVKKEKKEKEKKNKKQDQAAVAPRFAVPGAQSVPPSASRPTPMPVPTPMPIAPPTPMPMPTPAPIPEPAVPIGAMQQTATNTLAQRDFGTTILITPDDDPKTVLMDDMLKGSEKRPYLIRIANGQKMFIEKDILKIGKESSYVDFYIGNNPSISRSHADIVLNNGNYYIVDNNSTNHTYINGQMIQGGKLVMLQENTKIRLSNEEFEFHFI